MTGTKILFSSAVASPSGAEKSVSAVPGQAFISEAEAAWWRYGSWLTGITLVLCALALCLPGVPVPDSYHAFADQDHWGILPHARDVLSNAAFAVAGVLLLWQGHRYIKSGVAHKRVVSAMHVTAWGLILTAVCSGVYHLQPNALGLVLDRLGMSVAFAGVLGLLVADRFAPVRVMPAMAVALLLGVACVVGDYLHNNTMPWILFQAGIAGLMLITPWITRGQGKAYDAPQPLLDIAWWQILIFYVVAKLCEVGDEAFWIWTDGWIGGHSLKHIVAAAAVWPVVQALRRKMQ